MCVYVGVLRANTKNKSTGEIKSRYVFRSSRASYTRETRRKKQGFPSGTVTQMIDLSIEAERGWGFTVTCPRASSAKENETVIDDWHLTVAGATESRINSLTSRHEYYISEDNSHFMANLYSLSKRKISHKTLDNYDSIRGKCICPCMFMCYHVTCISCICHVSV